MREILNLLVILASTSAVLLLPNYVAPEATGYIYRSDNNGPASLIQLGVPYQQPHAFAPPLPLAQPLQLQQPVIAYEIAPAPLPYVAESTIEDEDDEDGLDEGDFENGGGSDYEEQHQNTHGEKGSKGYNSKTLHAKGASGHYGKEHNEGFYQKGEGEKTSHHDEDDNHGKHYASSKGYKGGDHAHKKHHSKGEDITGYHKVYNKDEFKKDHDFYDVADKSGYFNKHGYAKSHHGNSDGGHKKGGSHDGGFDVEGHGKEGHLAKGHHVADEAGHSAEQGHQSHHNHHEDFAKKGGESHEKGYDFDDDDYDDDDEH